MVVSLGATVRAGKGVMFTVLAVESGQPVTVSCKLCHKVMVPDNPLGLNLQTFPTLLTPGPFTFRITFGPSTPAGFIV